MNHRLTAIVLFNSIEISSTLVADDVRTLIFEDNFDRNESQDVTDEIGNGWRTNSRTHPTKRMLRIAVPHSAVVDDLKIYSLP